MTALSVDAFIANLLVMQYTSDWQVTNGEMSESADVRRQELATVFEQGYCEDVGGETQLIESSISTERG